MGKVLALKLLRPDVAGDKTYKQRFHQEARVVSRLSHPNTIQVFDFGELDDGSLYIAMEYLPGRDLAWILRAQGALPEHRAISIAIQVLASLAEAHHQGIIHRDVKPANIILINRNDGEELAKVLDFGIARPPESEGRRNLTGIADLVGTPAYMSPEQARGENLDPRSDLYSVGAMLFELLTGRIVFTGPTSLSIVTKHMTELPPRFADVAPDKSLSRLVEQVVRKSLAKRREDRYPDATEMRRELERVRRELGQREADVSVNQEDVTPTRMARREDFDRFERSLRLKRTLAPLLALIGLIVLSLGVVEYWKRRSLEVVTGVEREPNNQPAEANLIRLGNAITGMIGAPLSDRESDRDVFRVDLPEPTSVTIDLTGVRDMNLVLEVLQLEKSATAAPSRLRRQLFLDDAPSGEGERVDALWADAGPLYVSIQERAYFTEPARPPRETTHATYVLTVAKTPADGQTEIEPNDTLETATPVAMGRAIVGYTGAAVPYTPSMADQIFSSVDFLVAQTPNPPPSSMVAIVAAPPSGALYVVNSADFEAWQRKVKELGNLSRASAFFPAPIQVSGMPRLINMTRSSHGFGVRIQAANADTRPGSQYAVAFVSDGTDGLAGAVDLAKTLLQHQRFKETREVLRLMEERFPQSSPQLSDLGAVLAEKEKQIPPLPLGESRGEGN
jgi:serine/threonine-protein kinase